MAKKKRDVRKMLVRFLTWDVDMIEWKLYQRGFNLDGMPWWTVSEFSFKKEKNIAATVYWLKGSLSIRVAREPNERPQHGVRP